MRPYYDRKVMYNTSKKLAVQGFVGLLKAARDPKRAMKKMNKTMKNVYKSLFPKSKDELALAEALKEYGHEDSDEEEDDDASTVAEEVLSDEQINLMNLRGEAEAQKRKYRGKPIPDQPNKHVDTVCITLTMLVNPPPHFIKRPPRTHLDDIREDPVVAKITAEAMRLGQHVNQVLRKYLLENLATAKNALVKGAVFSADAVSSEFTLPDDELNDKGMTDAPVDVATTNTPTDQNSLDAATLIETNETERSEFPALPGNALPDCDPENAGTENAGTENADPFKNSEEAHVHHRDPLDDVIFLKRKSKFDKLRDNMFRSKMPPQFARKKYRRQYYYKPAYFNKKLEADYLLSVQLRYLVKVPSLCLDQYQLLYLLDNRNLLLQRLKMDQPHWLRMQMTIQ